MHDQVSVIRPTSRHQCLLFSCWHGWNKHVHLPQRPLHILNKYKLKNAKQYNFFT